MGPFLPLFSLEVEHSYFPGNVCRGLGFVLTASSAHRLERAGCLLRMTDRGLIVLFDSSNADALRTRANDAIEPLRFDFLTRAADTHFANYTEGGFGSATSLLMLDSQQAVHDPATGRWRLHAGDNAGDPEVRLLKSDWAIEVLSPQERRAPPHFVLSIGVSAADVTEAQKQGKQQGRRYFCRLQARATVWKYCLFGDWAEAPGEVQVIDLAQACQFDAAVGERLPDGQSVLAVRSSAPIALQERSERRFQLRRRSSGSSGSSGTNNTHSTTITNGSGTGLGNSTDKVLIKRLPVASPQQLNRETLGGVSTLVSEIFVHR